MPLIQAVERSCQIIDLFDEFTTHLKITDISRELNLHKSTIHSLLQTLQKYGYIEQEEETSKYRLGIKLFERGNLVVYNLDIRSVAKEYLVQLSKETGYTLHLAILEGKEGVYIDKIKGASATVLYSRVGQRISIHSSGVGKTLVAFRTEEEQEEIFDSYAFNEKTPNTITDKPMFFDELKKIKCQGYAVDNEENEPGICCIAVPIWNYTNEVVASISISMPTPQLNKKEMNTLIPKLKIVGNKVSKQMGYNYQAITKH